MNLKVFASTGVPGPVVRGLLQALSPIFNIPPSRCSVIPTDDLATGAYDQKRGQYMAEVMLSRLLGEGGDDNVILGIVDVDIYVPGLNFVFGLAQPHGNAALISLCRLDPTFYGKPREPDLLLERAIKEAVHELGHVFGLRHCSGPNCVMRFSNSIREVDGKPREFCGRCRAILRENLGIFKAKNKGGRPDQNVQSPL